MIHIELTGDLMINYVRHDVGLGGIFRVDDQRANGTPYHIAADYLHQ